jgi:hypothetical protein
MVVWYPVPGVASGTERSTLVWGDGPGAGITNYLPSDGSSTDWNDPFYTFDGGLR